MDQEKKTQILDIVVVCILFVAGCFIGKLVKKAYDTWLSFNGPAIGILVLGELIWWRVRKNLIKKWEDKDRMRSKR